jgi:hypothetical protein
LESRSFDHLWQGGCFFIALPRGDDELDAGVLPHLDVSRPFQHLDDLEYAVGRDIMSIGKVTYRETTMDIRRRLVNERRENAPDILVHKVVNVPVLYLQFIAAGSGMTASAQRRSNS